MENRDIDQEMEPNPLKIACPSRDLVSVLGSKWVLLVIPILRQGPRRNGSLLRAIEGLSQKMLTQTLRNLEAFDLVERRDNGEVLRNVEYALTARGESLGMALEALDAWVAKNAFEVARTRRERARAEPGADSGRVEG
jgi:DNA-binding HxlR family transcriptional regulator